MFKNIPYASEILNVNKYITIVFVAALELH